VGSSLREPKLNFIFGYFGFGLEFEGLKENSNGHGSLKGYFEVGEKVFWWGCNWGCRREHEIVSF